MIIGVPKEIKTNENRVALVPGGAEALVNAGHTVLIEKNGGVGSGFEDNLYTNFGAQIVDTAAEVWKRADMIMKVKEPIAPEWPMMRKDQVIFTYFHFAADEALTRASIKSEAICIAYETVQLPTGELPLLTPMSEVAGRMAIQEGAKYLEKYFGGRGILLGGVPGVEPGHVLVIGGGIVGSNAARMAAGLGARVTIVDLSLNRLRYLADVMPANVQVIYSNRQNLLDNLLTADIVVGGVLLPGAKAPKLVRRDDLKLMKKGSVIVDVAVDQGGCVETIHATTHEDPIYEVEGVIHYAVANMPGGVPRTSTLALTNATFPYAMTLANKGWKTACKQDHALALGLNVAKGKVVYPGVAEAFDLDYTDVEKVLSVLERRGTGAQGPLVGQSVRVLVVKLPNFPAEWDLPRYGTEGSAAVDLRNAGETVIIPPLGRLLIPTGLAFALPGDMEAQVRPRSGLALNRGISIINTPCTIDSDYRGELRIPLINFDREPQEIVHGERIAQLLIARVLRIDWQETDVLPDSSRGQGGFGSTGRS